LISDDKSTSRHCAWCILDANLTRQGFIRFVRWMHCQDSHSLSVVCGGSYSTAMGEILAETLDYLCLIIKPFDNQTREVVRVCPTQDIDASRPPEVINSSEMRAAGLKLVGSQLKEVSALILSFKLAQSSRRRAP
jgi:hypothetical protein